MKKAIVIILVFIVCSCKGQTDSSFSNFVNKFEKIKVPFTMDENYIIDAYGEGKDVSNNYVEKFICKDRNKCKCLNKILPYYSDGYKKFMYSYGIRIPFSNKNYVKLLYYKTYQDGKTAEDFRLMEYILTVFDNMGNIISSEVIGKNNDAFSVTVSFDANNGIKTRQIYVLQEGSDLKNNKLKVKVTYKEYLINELTGMIENVGKERVEFKDAFWDEKIDDIKTIEK